MTETPAPGPPPPSKTARTALLATAALAVTQAPWIYLSLTFFRFENAAFAAWNFFTAAVVLALAAGVYFRKPAAVAAAILASYYELALSAYWAYFEQVKFLWAGAGLALVSAIFLTSLKEALVPPRTGKPLPSSPEAFALWIKENLEAIIIAFIMALVIRCFCIEVFKIPSSSMEPTLLGDVPTDLHRLEACPYKDYHIVRGGEGSGDRIMVTKFYYAASPIERYDVVVFKFPLNQAKNFIKRVVGLPGERLMIHHGDLYVRRDVSEPQRIARKPLRVQDSIWIDLVRVPSSNHGSLTSFDDFREHWSGPEGEERYQIQGGELRTLHGRREQDIRFEFKTYIQDDTGQRVGDVRVGFDFELTGPKGDVFAEISSEHGRFEAILSTENAGVLRYFAPDNKGAQWSNEWPLRDARIEPERRYRFELAVFDGKAYVRLNGSVRREYEFIETLADEKINRDLPRTRVAFGARGVTFKVRRLNVGRDIYYRGKGDRGLGDDQEEPILDGHYLMMGDNVNNSHDSRLWTRYVYQKTDGTTIECEGQETTDGSAGYDTKELVRKELGLDFVPDVAIKSDKNGIKHGLRTEELVKQEDGRHYRTVPYRTVPRTYIVGKGFWIWWPPGRWFHLIR